MGPLKGIYVKEGDHVRKGQILASIEVHPAYGGCRRAESRLELRRKPIPQPAKQAVKASDENIAVSIATVNHDKADLEQKKADFERAKALFDAKLLAQQDFDAKRGAYDVAVAMLAETEGRLSQAKAQRARGCGATGGRPEAHRATAGHAHQITDVLQKYDAIAPTRWRSNQSCPCAWAKPWFPGSRIRPRQPS